MTVCGCGYADREWLTIRLRAPNDDAITSTTPAQRQVCQSGPYICCAHLTDLRDLPITLRDRPIAQRHRSIAQIGQMRTTLMSNSSVDLSQDLGVWAWVPWVYLIISVFNIKLHHLITSQFDSTRLSWVLRALSYANESTVIVMSRVNKRTNYGKP